MSKWTNETERQVWSVLKRQFLSMLSYVYQNLRANTLNRVDNVCVYVCVSVCMCHILDRKKCTKMCWLSLKNIVYYCATTA